MLNWETARRESLRREIDRVRLNIEKLRGQLAVYTDEVAVRRWAEQAGMVRVDTQPELTIVGFGRPRYLPSHSRCTCANREAPKWQRGVQPCATQLCA